MSSRAVRRFARDAVATCGVPYYDTINLSQQMPPAPWCTLEFDPYGTEKLTWCDSRKETGVITLTFFGPPGEGDDNLLAVAEAAAQFFYDYKDPNDAVHLNTFGSAETFEAEGDTPQFIVQFEFEYERYL